MNPEIAENREIRRAANIALAKNWEQNASKEQLGTRDNIEKMAGVVDGKAGPIPCSEIEYNLIESGVLAEDWDKID